MAMRLTGLMSGMDTESVIKELVAVRQTKVDKTKKAQTRLSWKQDAWKELNSKIYSLYTQTLSDMRFSGTYAKKTTKVSNSSVVSVITGADAMNSVQTLKVDKLASSGYLTGGKVGGGEKDLTGDSTLKEAGVTLAGGKGSIAVMVGGAMSEIEVTEDTTIDNLLTDLRKAGVNASFDGKNQRFYVSSKTSGAEGNFLLAGLDDAGVDALAGLGIGVYDDMVKYAGGVAGLELRNPGEFEREVKSTVASRLSQIQKAQQEMEAKLADMRSGLASLGVGSLDELEDLDATGLAGKVSGFMQSEAYYKLSSEDQAKLVNYRDDLDRYASDMADNSRYFTVDENGKYHATATLETEVRNDLTDMIERISQTTGHVEAVRDKLEGENKPHKNEGADALIYLNGAEYTSNSNTFEINGLTLTVNAKTAPDEEVTLTTQDDTDGVYDMIKNFITKYNELVNEMDKLYNADAAKGYEPLTEEEKAEMSESSIDKWEQKIKDSILRGDSTLSTVSSAMRMIMSSSVTMSDGSKMYLSDFGIETLGYFTAPENERNAYHIAGNPDDASVSGNTDKLKSMIASDPEKVIDFFTGLSKNLYNRLGELMKGTELSSAFTVYDDKAMQIEYDNYTAEIKSQEKKLQEYEDKWYAKFAAMETALAKMQSNASAVTSLLGG